MNDIQKTQITSMRAKGAGYKSIAKELGISENTIKSYCRRNNLTSTDEIKVIKDNEVFCKNCGAVVPQNDKRKVKQFCSDKCRMAWWNSHRDMVKHKKVTVKACSYCHKKFEVYGNSNKKYCSHDCYVADRFGGGKQ